MLSSYNRLKIEHKGKNPRDLLPNIADILSNTELVKML